MYLHQESRIWIMLRTDWLNCEEQWSWVHWWAWCLLKRPKVSTLTTDGNGALVRWHFPVRNKIFVGQNLPHCQISTKNPTWIIPEIRAGLCSEISRRQAARWQYLCCLHTARTLELRHCFIVLFTVLIRQMCYLLKWDQHWPQLGTALGRLTFL